jgi:hypothetical protein
MPNNLDSFVTVVHPTGKELYDQAIEGMEKLRDCLRSVPHEGPWLGEDAWDDIYFYLQAFPPPKESAPPRLDEVCAKLDALTEIVKKSTADTARQLKRMGYWTGGIK